MAKPSREILKLLSLPACPVREFISLIGLLTATEKHLRRMHMRPIQWHLINNWRVPESLETVIQIPRSLHPHLQWWLKEDNILTGQPLHPIKHALQIFTDASTEGWGAHLNELQDLCANKIVLVATDDTSGVIHKQGRRHEVGPTLCPTMEYLDLVYQETSDSQNPTLSSPAERRSRQAVQAGPDRPGWSPSVMQQVAPAHDRFICHMRLNKLPLFVSPVPDPLATAVDALGLPWEDLDAYALPPAAILGKVVEKLQDFLRKRIFLIAPGRPNIPWFWDLVAMSIQIPLSLPNLLTALQSDPSQKSDKSKSPCMAPRASAIKEQDFSDAVGAIIEAPQRGSTRSGCEARWPFLQSGASLIRWTSGHL